MMRTSLTLFIFVLASVFYTATAQDYKVAVGVRLSNATPTLSNAITVKYHMNQRSALEGIISFGSRFGLGGLYEVHNMTTVQGLNWFYGGGVYVGFENEDTYLGPTGIIGLDYKFPNIPLNLSLDWKPELDFIPAINFVPDAFGFSARFTF
ncbi:MAG TPA: hypothetical protein VD993_03040 [Chitinophagaceae bacterium]|nr:hypothetical protein [Chitinophagaceae bacterium]